MNELEYQLDFIKEKFKIENFTFMYSANDGKFGSIIVGSVRDMCVGAAFLNEKVRHSMNQYIEKSEGGTNAN